MALPEDSDVLMKLRRNLSAEGHIRTVVQRRPPAAALEQTRLARTMVNQIQFLKTIPLFAELLSGELRSIAKDVRERHYAQGESLFREGDPGAVLYIVKSGQVRIFVHGNGSGVETSVILCGRPGDIFGELAIVDGLPRSASAMAMEETIVYTINRDAFRFHMRRMPQLALNFMQLLSVRVRYNTKQVNSFASLSIPKRLARTLLELAQNYGEVDDAGVRISANLTQSDLASLIGATRESTNKALSIFRRQELISLSGDHIIVLDPEALRKQVNDA